MHKNIIWYAAVLLIVYFTLVFCEETETYETQAQIANTDTDTDTDTGLPNAGSDLLEVEGRTRRHRHHLFWYRHLWPLAIAYWIKVKVVIVSFFLGSAIYLGLRYFWPHKCNHEIILDHPPSGYGAHDHIPYSLDHSEHVHEHEHAEHYDSPTSFDASSLEPYSGYSSYSSGPEIISSAQNDAADVHQLGKRSISVTDDGSEEEELEEIDENISESVARQQPAEEQIADFMFAFLGLDSKACRRRFVCEMEFRSKLNPLSSMAFRIVGRGFFEKYTNAHNPQARATSFVECAAVNAECVFVEGEQPAADADAEAAEETATTQQVDTASEDSSLETQNQVNLQAERRHAKIKQRRGDRMFSSIAEHILTHTQ